VAALAVPVVALGHVGEERGVLGHASLKAFGGCTNNIGGPLLGMGKDVGTNRERGLAQTRKPHDASTWEVLAGSTEVLDSDPCRGRIDDLGQGTIGKDGGSPEARYAANRVGEEPDLPRHPEALGRFYPSRRVMHRQPHHSDLPGERHEPDPRELPTSTEPKLAFNVVLIN
jgi:hypothetical protein